MDRNDLEKNKFDLTNWKVGLKNSEEISWTENIWDRDINDMERDKFDPDWNIRIVTVI